MQYTIQKPYKWLPNMQKKKVNSNFCHVFRDIFGKLIFRNMGMVGSKRGACPPIMYSFFMNFNEEALLKVSLKNLHWFQSYKSPLFKNCPKKLIKVENFIFFFILGNNFIGLFNGILHVLIF